MQLNLSYDPVRAVTALIKAGVAIGGALLLVFVLKFLAVFVPGVSITAEHASLLACALAGWWSRSLLPAVWAEKG